MEFNLNSNLTIFLISLALLALYPRISLENAMELIVVLKQSSSKGKYPDGPKGYPIVGVGPMIPPVNPGPTLSRWAKQYGEMMTLKLGGTRWVFLNSSRTAREILERRSGITSSRPAWPLLQGILSDGKRMVLMPYDNKWRNIRKIMHQLLTAKQAETYRPFQDRESKQLLWDYLHAPDDFWRHNGRYANSVIMSVVFGKRTRADDPNVIQLFGTIDDFLGNTTPGKWLVDSFPSLAKLPKSLQWWRPFAEDGYRRTIDVYKKFFAEFEKSVADGTAAECFATKFNDVVGKYDFEPDQQKFIAGTLVEAGSDTTRNQNNILVAAAATDMSWVHRVRVQIDEVCGSNAERLPQWSDFEKLPLIQAVIKETLRWRPNLAEAGFPHVVTEDFEFEGYHIEKGTVVTWNSWNISMSDEEYEDAWNFKPERFMDEHVYDTLQGNWGFGAGRRVCVGYIIAARNMYMVFSRLLYCFDFAEGHPIDTTKIAAQSEGKTPFRVKITPRSAKHAELIRRECKEVADELEKINLGDDRYLKVAM